MGVAVFVLVGVLGGSCSEWWVGGGNPGFRHDKVQRDGLSPVYNAICDHLARTELHLAIRID